MALKSKCAESSGIGYAQKKLHELNRDELDDYSIGERSRFRDEKWFFTNHLPGAPKANSTLNWAMVLSDGSSLTDSRHATRLHWAKLLLLTLVVVPANQRIRAAGSMANIQASFNYLLSWMSECGYHAPHELKPDAVRCFMDHVAPIIAARCIDAELNRNTFSRGLFVIAHLWNQRRSLLQMGIEPMTVHPFDGKTPDEVGRELSAKVSKWVPPLPDEVALAVLNKAAWFLGTPADDVLRLMDVFTDPLAGSTVTVKSDIRSDYTHKAGLKNCARHKRVRRFLDRFEFGIVAGESRAWHEPILSSHAESSHDAECSNEKYEGKRRVADLWQAVRDAAAIIVQAMTGMRASELLSIKAGIDKRSQLPSEVRIELSLTGLYEWFVVRSIISKTEEGSPREVDWVLGMRPAGTTQIPLAVKALCIVNALQAPWVTQARTDHLFLSISHGKGLLRTHAAANSIGVKKLNTHMQRFIMNWVDLTWLPDQSAHHVTESDLVPWRESRGEIFRTHMLRKTWAQFALACDSRLLPAIQMQFHHLSLAMTEGSYIGRNPMLLEALNSVSVQKRNLLLYEAVIGKSQLAGRMGDQLDSALGELRTEVSNLPKSEKWSRTVVWADRNDLRMFFSAHATCCPTRNSEMRCHDVSKTPIWVRWAPNTSTRTPGLCAGCACAIMDKSHEKFWSDRYTESQRSLFAAKNIGIAHGSFREIRFRAEQARAILKRFGADISALDQVALARLEVPCPR
ncbi:hypothetical protein J2X54_001646 [Duganella sp. 3397]|uniref:integrase n=1 Tax=Duganella sp. 3397 TaxID=2817732 RepID=UPI0028614C28|nr:integrase [Duganella sp. 3397]MDR7049198.1 hypothetical protein [Duganella sp. 3397]